MKVKKKENESLCVFYHRFTQGFCSPIKWNEGKKRKKKNSDSLRNNIPDTYTKRENSRQVFVSRKGTSTSTVEFCPLSLLKPVRTSHIFLLKWIMPVVLTLIYISTTFIEYKATFKKRGNQKKINKRECWMYQ